MISLKDIQEEKETRGIAIQRVGISKLKHPIVFRDQNNYTQSSIATVELSVDLDKNKKGTHMSRFIECLNSFTPPFSADNLADITEQLLELLECHNSYMSFSFSYFLDKAAPVSRKKGFVDYNVTFETHSHRGSKSTVVMKLQIPVSTLCPCSKAISKYGAHNQRGLVTVQIPLAISISISKVIHLVEQASSSPLYSLLKRSDEKFVTEQAYENPVFVEDLVRNVAQKLQKEPNITKYKITVENYESIHNHNAIAIIDLLD